MFLLIPIFLPATMGYISIYIPLCFYLYLDPDEDPEELEPIYIPLCFYLYPCPADISCIWYTFTFHYVSTYTTSITVDNTLITGFTFHYVSTYTTWRSTTSLPLFNLHSTMFLLILVHFPPLIHTVSRPPNCRPLYFLPHPPLFSCLFFYFPVYYSRNMRFVDFPQFRHYLRSTITGSYLFYHLGCPRILLVSTFHFGT